MSTWRESSCRCGNYARLGSDRCGRCLDADTTKATKDQLLDAIMTRAYLIEDKATRAFANAVLRYLQD
jgi:hypothetical protein